MSCCCWKEEIIPSAKTSLDLFSSGQYLTICPVLPHLKHVGLDLGRSFVPYSMCWPLHLKYWSQNVLNGFLDAKILLTFLSNYLGSAIPSSYVLLAVSTLAVGIDIFISISFIPGNCWGGDWNALWEAIDKFQFHSLIQPSFDEFC